jgi:hypothetical protein
MVYPEYKSIEAFASFLEDEGRSSFSVDELDTLNATLHKPMQEIRKGLEALGFALVPRQVPKRVRGFTTSSHDRWFGPGSNS